MELTKSTQVSRPRHLVFMSHVMRDTSTSSVSGKQHSNNSPAVFLRVNGIDHVITPHLEIIVLPSTPPACTRRCPLPLQSCAILRRLNFMKITTLPSGKMDAAHNRYSSTTNHNARINSNEDGNIIVAIYISTGNMATPFTIRQYGNVTPHLQLRPDGTRHNHQDTTNFTHTTR